jgi:hypothetical protein
MKKVPVKKSSGDLRDEYDLSKLRGGVRGKYLSRATAGSNLVLIEPELSNLFPDSDSVNKALRLLVKAAQGATGSRQKTR